MATTGTKSFCHKEYPPRADLRKIMDQQPLPTLAPGLIGSTSMTSDEATSQARAVLDIFNAALAVDDAKTLESCFYADQAYWKDQLSLTYHLRTFNTPGIISAGLLETAKLRGISKGIEIDGSAMLLPVTPTLQFIDCPLVFQTSSPATTCRGKIMLLPVKDTGYNKVVWKIWVLFTRLESLDIQPEDEILLRSPRRQIDNAESFETDVFIIGGGNAGVTLSARLKALGVDSLLAEQNPRVGDNWALRYDCMKFHIPTSVCDMPYMEYGEELRTPNFLTRQNLASQVQQYVKKFNLNMITSAKIQSTQYDESAKRWKINFQTPHGKRTAVSKQLVLATGYGSQKPNLPTIANREIYKGISIHSAEYKNATALKEQDVKTVMIIGSANTAFDILEECHATGLNSTMNVRSPTYIVPLDYVCHKSSLGAYDGGVAAADKLFLSLPSVIEGQLGRDLFAMFASAEPERYAALQAAGFPVLDSRDPNCALIHNLLERAGGHYVDVGGTKLIEEGKVGTKANAEPVAYTKTGLRFSDGSCVDADAIIWCTGYADANVCDTAAEILGSASAVDGVSSGVNDEIKHLLGPREIASRLDATWSIDSEGEIRGMWKRHLGLDNFWIMGGYTQQHRWHSRTLALQIKAALEGILPPAYRDTPTPRVE